MNLFYGRLGYMPLDQSIVFDGAWRILSGQTPYRDFVTPFGIVPLYLQAAFFKIFGVSWFSYVLHASILNGLFCVLAYVLMRNLQVGHWHALLYAFLGGFLFYVPFGVPYPDQHSFFFLFACLVLAAVSNDAAVAKIKTTAWFCLPLVFSIAFLSKQTPAVLGLPLLALLFALEQGAVKARVIGVLAGAALSVLVWTFLFQIAGAHADHLRLYFWDLPRELGAERLLISAMSAD